MILNHLCQSSRRVCVLSAAAVLLSAGSFAQTAPTAPAAPSPAPSAAPAPFARLGAIRAAPPEDEPVVLDLPDTDIDTVISTLETLTGRLVIRPQQLTTATYNIRIKKPLPKSEALLYIETVLALNNIGIAPLGDKLIKVVDAGRVKQEAPEMINGSSLDYPATGKVATKLFQLEFARVAEVIPLFGGLLNPFYGGPVPLQNANAALITDSISNLQRVELLLQQVDKPVTAGMKPKFYTLKNAKASDLVNKLRAILAGTLQQQLGSATSYNADDRTNQIVLVTDPRQHAFFDDLIDRLDQKSDPNTRNDVLYLKHAKAADVVNVLSRIISGQTTATQRQSPGSVRPGQVQPTAPGAPAAPPAQPMIVSASSANNPNLDALMSSGANEFSAVMTVVSDERSNSVVAFGTADDLRLVRELIDKLDIVLAQVRIEVVIAEVTLDDNDASGISALGLKLEGDKLVGFSGTIETGAAVTNGVITRPGVTGRMDLAAELSITSTLRKRNNAIVTVPAIVTSHGKQAKFFNGETRPVVTGSITSGTVGGTTSTVTQQQIGTTVTVTPFIGVDGSVQLDIVQDVQDVIGTVPVDNNQQYIIGQRQTTSYVTTKTGEIIVLGGFRKNIQVRERSRLGPIPFLGDLFGRRTKNDSRQELVFFLRPTVLTNSPAIDNAEALKRIEKLPTRDTIKGELDSNFVPPAHQSTLGKILSK
jgi:general secretion pathway protein D